MMSVGFNLMIVYKLGLLLRKCGVIPYTELTSIV